MFRVPDQPAVGVYELASTPTAHTAPYEGPTCPRADVGSACPHGDVGSDTPLPMSPRGCVGSASQEWSLTHRDRTRLRRTQRKAVTQKLSAVRAVPQRRRHARRGTAPGGKEKEKCARGRGCWLRRGCRDLGGMNETCHGLPRQTHLGL